MICSLRRSNNSESILGDNILQTLMKRDDIPQEYKWDLESIFPSDEDWENSYTTLQRRLPELEALKRTLAQNWQALLAALLKRGQLFGRVETCFVCASLSSAGDSPNSDDQRMRDRAMRRDVR